jgi:hypothetical protein
VGEPLKRSVLRQLLESMNIALLIAIIISSIALPLPNVSQCGCRVSDESTRAGANENIVIAPSAKYHRLEGVVQDVNGQVLSDVLVEVLDNPDYLLLKYPESEEKKKEQRRLAGCVVGPDGKFCFTGLPPGKYELRFSKDGGWKRTQMLVVVAPANRSASKRRLEIAMQVGT